MTTSERQLSRKTVMTYALGSMGTGGFATLPGLVLIYYMTDTLGIAAIVAGLLVALAKAWDVLIDPVIGARSDNDLAATGSRRRFMLVGGMLLPVFFLATFAVPPALGPLPSGIWVFVAFSAAATAFSLFQVPYIALPAELTTSYDQRTRLLSVRVLVLSVAILLFGAGGPALRSLGGGNPWWGYFLMALVAGALIGGCMVLAARVAPIQPVRGVEAGSVSRDYRKGWDALSGSQPFRSLLLTFALQGLATGGMLAGAQYVATWVLHDEQAVTLIFVALIGPALLGVPVWRRVAKRLGKERAFGQASLLFCVAALALTGMLIAPGPWIYLPVALAGAGYAGMQALPMSMLPDVVTHDTHTRGERRAGVFGGLWTAGESAGMALGATLLTVVLWASGYVESTAGVAVAQPPLAVNGIILGFSLVPAAIIGLSLLVFRSYPLRESDITEAARRPATSTPEGT
ncbi:MFS transporter [Paeniglutamicibacter sp. R2-26]|uniref:MFS transporter n=1 Tax=Paeniglutamicibacter sp. R2-26 TaxID=3144417 RepID=UPI003EE67E0D